MNNMPEVRDHLSNWMTTGRPGGADMRPLAGPFSGQELCSRASSNRHFMADRVR